MLTDKTHARIVGVLFLVATDERTDAAKLLATGDDEAIDLTRAEAIVSGQT